MTESETMIRIVRRNYLFTVPQVILGVRTSDVLFSLKHTKDIWKFV